jgi:putative SOS response-associated peptidase YedK
MCVHYQIIDGQLVATLVKKIMGVGYVAVKTWVVGAWPKAEIPVITQENGERRCEPMRWGVRADYDFADNWVPIVNARDDKITASKMWNEPFATRRCLAPADSFFEWVGPKGARYEVEFARVDRGAFFFAALWSPDRRPGGGRGFAILTTSPNAQIAAVPHDRMPALLDEDAANAWLGDKPADVMNLIRPYVGKFVQRSLQVPERKKKITKNDLQNGELELGL